MAEEGATAKWSDLRRRVKEQQEEERKRKEMEKSEEERMLEKDDRWSAFMKVGVDQLPLVRVRVDRCESYGFFLGLYDKKYIIW